VNFWRGLEAHVHKHHPTGLSWSQNGKDAPHILKFPKRGYPYGSTRGVTPKLHFDNINGKWYCEHQIGSKIMNIEGEKKQTCYIRDCEHANIHVKGKPISITVDGCWYVKVIAETATTINIVNCFSIVVVINGSVSNINVNKTHKCALKCLDKETSANTEISSEATTKLTVEDSDGSSEIPTLLRTKVQKGKLIVL